MLEICLKNKIIYDFLQKYKQKKWCNIIPSLLEIAILNLYISFKRYIFSENDLSLIIENLKLKYTPYNPILSQEIIINPKKILQNKKKETLDINIAKFRNNLKLNLQELNEKKDLYRSFTKRPKNINELNIYSTNENKKIHYYIKSSEVTPIRGFINYNETDISQHDNRYKNIYKKDKYNKRHNKNNFKNVNINNPNKLVDYKTIDHSDFMNKEYQSIFNLYKNYNQNMNYSFSLEHNNNNNKYIKVNKNNGNKMIKEKNIYNDKGYLLKKENNNNNINNYKEINSKNNKIKKILKYKLINENNKKNKNNSNSLNFNQKQVITKNENKNN